MSKVTPGKWEAKPWTNDEDDISHFEIVSKERDCQIADVHMSGYVKTPEKVITLEEAKANATLIHAAPELLDGLKQAVEQMARDYEPTPLDGMGALIRKLKAVIEKASGKGAE